MATCPDCGRRDAMTLDRTGETILVARPLGTWSLAGAQMKTSARQVEVLVLACDPDPAHGGGCGWTVRGYIDGESLMALPANREETP